MSGEDDGLRADGSGEPAGNASHRNLDDECRHCGKGKDAADEIAPVCRGHWSFGPEWTCGECVEDRGMRPRRVMTDGGVFDSRIPCPCEACDGWTLSEDEYCVECMHLGCGPDPKCRLATDGGGSVENKHASPNEFRCLDCGHEVEEYREHTIPLKDCPECEDGRLQHVGPIIDQCDECGAGLLYNGNPGLGGYSEESLCDNCYDRRQSLVTDGGEPSTMERIEALRAVDVESITHADGCEAMEGETAAEAEKCGLPASYRVTLDSEYEDEPIELNTCPGHMRNWTDHDPSLRPDTDDTDADVGSKIPTEKQVNTRDWECRDCGIWYSADNDASAFDLPDFCPNCGDHLGWINVKDGRTVP